jgi:hypothetical protein
MDGRYYGTTVLGIMYVVVVVAFFVVVCSFVPTMGTRVIVIWVDGYTVGIPVLARYWREA